MVPWIPIELLEALRSAHSRQALLDQVDAWLAGEDRILLLTGGPGTGKSTLCAQLGVRLAAAGRETLGYFCSTRLQGTSLSPRYFVAALAGQIRDIHPEVPLVDTGLSARPLSLTGTVTATQASGTVSGISIGQIIIQPESASDLFQRLVAEPLRGLLAGRPPGSTVLVIDGLDQAASHPGSTIVDVVLDNIGSLPPECKMILSTQAQANIVERLRGLERRCREINLSSPANLAAARLEIAQWAEQRLLRSPRLDPAAAERRARQISVASDGSFLHASALVGELERDPGYVMGTTPREIRRYYWELLSRVRDDAQRNGQQAWTLAARVLGVLAVAKAPMTVRDIADVAQLPRSSVAQALMTLSPLLQSLPAVGGDRSSDGDQLILLANTALAEFLRTPTLDDAGWNDFSFDEPNLLFDILQRFFSRLDRLRATPDVYLTTFAGSHLLDLAGERPDLAEKICAECDWQQYCAVQGDRGLDLLAPEESATAAVQVYQRWYHPGPGDWWRLATTFAHSPSPYLRSAAGDALSSALLSDNLLVQTIWSLLTPDDLPSWSLAEQLLIQAPVAVREAVIRQVAFAADRRRNRRLAYAVPFLLAETPHAVSLEWLNAVLQRISLWRPVSLRRGLEFMAHASIGAYVCNCHDVRVAEATSGLWESVFKNKLHLDAVNRSAFSSAISFAAAEALAEQLTDHAIVSGDFERRRGARGTSDLEELLDHLDPQASLVSAHASLANAFESDSYMLNLLAAMVLATRSMVAPDDGEHFLEQHFDSSSEQAMAWMLSAFNVIMPITPPEWGELVSRFTVDFIARGPGVRGPIGEMWPIAWPLAAAKAGRGVEGILRLGRTTAPVIRAELMKGVAAAGLFFPKSVLAAVAGLRDEASETVWLEELQTVAQRVGILHTQLAKLTMNELGQPRTAVPPEEVGEWARGLIDGLGLYNNGVHQAVNYPKMRAGLLRPAFRLLITSGDEKTFVRRYTPFVLAMLRDADYRLLAWTTT